MSEASPTGSDAMICRSAQLNTGVISTTHPADVNSEALYGFGERINPRRSFLFISRVLGRHVPVVPGVARAAFSALADKLDADLPGPVLITSMAETAVGLGAGVHDAYLERTQRHDVLNLSSTRGARSQAIFGQFSEAHSHASGHTLYVPASQRDRELLKACRTLVMVDDESSSGNTFRSLGATLYESGIQQLERIITLTLTDWSSESISVATKANSAGFIDAEQLSLLSGRYHWQAAPDATLMELPDPDAPANLASAPVERLGDARIGNSTRTPCTVPEALMQVVTPLKTDSRPLLIVGTGEHVWEPFLVAETLEKAGFDVRLGATTRSPILIGGDISCAYSFSDHEGLGISNYLYNVDPADYSGIILCVDTHIDAIDRKLLMALQAHLLFPTLFMEYKDLMDNSSSLKPAVLKRSNG